MTSTTPNNGDTELRQAGGFQAPGPAAPSTVRSSVGRSTRVLYAALGALALIVVWELLSLWVDPIFIASPLETAKALGHLADGGDLWIQLLITLKRVVIGLAIGGALGWIVGMAAGLAPRLRSFLEPVRWVAMTVPAVIVAVLALLWFGLGDLSVIFVVAVIVTPSMYVNTVAGVLTIDPRLVELGRVYHFPRMLRLTEIYLPGAAPSAIAGLTLATGVAVRAVVLAEVLGSMSGIGHAFGRAKSNLEMPEVYAWVVLLLALMALLEFGILRPLKRRALRWRKVVA